MQIVSANGASIPALGFGTFRVPGPDTERMVAHVLRNGYRHIDTAQIYGNEAEVGDGIRHSGIARADLFLTTKVWVENYRHEAFVASVDESLKKLKTDYVDLLLLHWPNATVPLAEQIGALNDVARAGKVRHIGVSNFNRVLMREAAALSELPLVTNQVEYHPYLDQSKLLAAVRQRGMAFVAYCPLGRGRLFSDPVLTEIAKARGRSIAQIALRWLMQQNVAAIPRSSNPARIADNFKVFDFTLSDAEMKRISALKRPNGRIANPVERVSGGWD